MATVITNSNITIDGNTNLSGTNVNADSATITNLSGTNVTADSATITNLTTTNLSGNINADSVTITNLSGTNVTADSATITNLTTTNLSGTNMTASGDITGSSFNSGQLGGRRNLIINGAMKVAQRGTSISGGTGRDSYGLDRFVFEATDNPITTQVTHSNSQITDGNRNALKISTTGTAIGTAQVHQRIERETFRHTIGQTVTFSCLVKRNSSNVTGGTLRMIASVNANATYVLRDNPGIYPSHTVTETLVTGVQNIPTDYTRYTASFTMPSGANTTDILEIGLSFYLFDGSTNTNEDLFSISEMQLELGDTATPFEHRSYGEELALCQRYYQLNSPGTGVSYTTTDLTVAFPAIVPFRTGPISHTYLTIINGTNAAVDPGISLRNITAIPSLPLAGDVNGVIANLTVSSTTNGKTHSVFGGVIGIDVEL